MKPDLRRELYLCSFAIRSAAGFASAVLLAGVLTGCNNQDAGQVKQQAQQQTEQTKQEAKQLGQDAKTELKQGADDVVAAAQGIKAGINAKTSGDSSGNGSNAVASNGMTADGRIDLNSASAAQLRTLPGIRAAQANAIVAARPFSTPADVVAKGALTRVQYSRIAGRVAVL